LKSEGVVHSGSDTARLLLYICSFNFNFNFNFLEEWRFLKRTYFTKEIDTETNKGGMTRATLTARSGVARQMLNIAMVVKHAITIWWCSAVVDAHAMQQHSIDMSGTVSSPQHTSICCAID
jgi:hypothetical protein